MHTTPNYLLSDIDYLKFNSKSSLSNTEKQKKIGNQQLKYLIDILSINIDNRNNLLEFISQIIELD